MARNDGPYGGHSRRRGSQRTGETFSLSQFAASQRARIYDGVSPERRQQFEAAERRAQIMRAWNEVCADTRGISLIDGRAETECSGNVTRENVERLLELGVDYISSGALTHSAPILDISLKNLHAI